MQLYEVVSLLLCSWKAEVYIHKIYNTGALKEITIWKDVPPTLPKQTETHLHYTALLSWLPIRKSVVVKNETKDFVHQMLELYNIAKCLRTPEHYTHV